MIKSKHLGENFEVLYRAMKNGLIYLKNNTYQANLRIKSNTET